MYNHVLTLILDGSVDYLLDANDGALDLEGDEIYLMGADVYDARRRR